MAWLLIVALVLGTSAATFVNSLGNIIRTRESTDVFSPSLDTFQNLAAGRKTFCMERLGVCNTMSCEYCRCWNTSDVFMSYNIGCIHSMQLTSDIQSDKCVLLHLNHSWIPTIRQNISDKAQYRLHQQANFPSNFETINMKCDSAQVYNVYGDAKLTLYENPTGSRIQILDTQTYKKIQFKFSDEEMKNMSGMLVYVKLECNFDQKTFESCVLFKVEGRYMVPGYESINLSTTFAPITTVKEDTSKKGGNMEVIKAVVIVGCIFLVFLLVFIYFCYKRCQYKQRIARNQAVEYSETTKTETGWGNSIMAPYEDIRKEALRKDTNTSNNSTSIPNCVAPSAGNTSVVDDDNLKHKTNESTDVYTELNNDAPTTNPTLYNDLHKYEEVDDNNFNTEANKQRKVSHLKNPTDKEGSQANGSFDKFALESKNSSSVVSMSDEPYFELENGEISDKSVGNKPEDENLNKADSNEKEGNKSATLNNNNSNPLYSISNPQYERKDEIRLSNDVKINNDLTTEDTNANTNTSDEKEAENLYYGSAALNQSSAVPVPEENINNGNSDLTDTNRNGDNNIDKDGADKSSKNPNQSTNNTQESLYEEVKKV